MFKIVSTDVWKVIQFFFTIPKGQEAKAKCVVAVEREDEFDVDVARIHFLHFTHDTHARGTFNMNCYVMASLKPGIWSRITSFIGLKPEVQVTYP